MFHRNIHLYNECSGIHQYLQHFFFHWKQLSDQVKALTDTGTAYILLSILCIL